jgi:hypothetical protein
MKLAKKGKADKPQLAERRSSHRTQWASQFAVASELCKRGYEVAFTMGNHPSVDLLVNSPNQVAFSVDVKGLYKKNFWAESPRNLRHGASRTDLGCRRRRTSDRPFHPEK